MLMKSEVKSRDALVLFSEVFSHNGGAGEFVFFDSGWFFPTQQQQQQNN